MELNMHTMTVSQLEFPHYRCPRYPPIAQGCYMVRDVYNPCCETPVCPFPPTQPSVTQQPTPGTTQVPPTGPDGQTLRPPVISTRELILHCLMFCLSGLPASSVHSLCCIKKCAARFILKTLK